MAYVMPLIMFCNQAENQPFGTAIYERTDQNVKRDMKLEMSKAGKTHRDLV